MLIDDRKRRVLVGAGDVVADRKLGQAAIASMYCARRKKDQDECVTASREFLAFRQCRR
jgi:hypothetical protein